jgi:hypothetical protein
VYERVKAELQTAASRLKQEEISVHEVG